MIFIFVMEKIIKKKVTGAEIRYALMGYGYEPYIITSISWIIGTYDYLLTMKLKE